MVPPVTSAPETPFDHPSGPGAEDTPSAPETSAVPPPADQLSEVLRARGWGPGLLRLTVALGLALALGSGMMVACHTKVSAVRNTNVGSRYGQVEGLVNHGTYAITKTRYNRTIDKVRLPNGEWLSSKPPLLPTVTAGVYWLYRGVTGHDIRTHEKQVVRFCNWVMGALLHTVLLIFWLRFLLLITARPETIVLLVATVAFGFLGAGYAIELNNHSVAATITMVAFYYAYRARNDLDARTRHWVFSGALAGLLPAVDVPSALVSAGLFVYLATKDLKRALLFFALPALPGPILAITLNIISNGSPLPVQMQPELKKGTYWANPKGVDALNEPKHIYGFNVLVGHHGIFTMTPVLIYALVWVGRRLRKAGRALPYRAETLALGLALLGLITFYIWRTRNYGGNCVGFRWAVAWTPLLFVFVAFHLSTVVLRARHIAFVAFGTAVCAFHVYECFWTPWHEGKWQRWVAGHLARQLGW
jgi:hypothetical protein